MTENAETQETKNLRALLRTMTEARDELRARVIVAESLLTTEQLQQAESAMDAYRWERDVPKSRV